MFYRAKLEKCIEVAQPFFKAKISVKTLMTASKSPKYTWPRFFIMGMLWKNSHLSLPQLARMFCLKNHTTVLHGVRRAYEIWGEGFLRQEYQDAFDYTFVNGEGWVLTKHFQARLDEEL